MARPSGAGAVPPSRAVVCLTTYNRVDCARINLELLKLNYARPFTVVHACSGEWPPGLEDLLVRCAQPQAQTPEMSRLERIALLQRGALNLIQQGLQATRQAYAPRYIVHLEGDTWIMDEHVIHRALDRMDRDPRLMLYTSAWDEDLVAFDYLKRRDAKARFRLAWARLQRRLGRPAGLACRDSLATQFFIMRATPEMMDCFMSLQPIPGLDLEQALHRSFFRRFGERNLLRQREREPVHPFNRYVCRELSLYSQHWPARGTAGDLRDPTHPRFIPPTADGKQEILRRFGSCRRGEHLQRLLSADSVAYYNPGAPRT